MLYDASGADGLATLGADTQQHLEFGIHSDQLAQRRGHLDGLGLLLLGHAGIDVLRWVCDRRGANPNIGVGCPKLLGRAQAARLIPLY
jgi:hypothetical protein